MTLRAALFDVDGTLLDSNELQAKAWRRAFADFDIHVPMPALRAQMGNGGDRLVEACAPEQAPKLCKPLIQRQIDIFTRDYLGQVRPFAGVRELFERLKSDGVRIALVSPAQEWERDRHVELLGVADLVDRTIRLKDIPPGEAVAVGDSPYDARAARRAGMQAIGVLSGGFDKRDLWEAGARMVFRDVADLLECYEASPFGGMSPGEPRGGLISGRGAGTQDTASVR